MSDILTGDTGVGDATRARLTFDLDADICVVGAGLAGLTVALEAARLGASVVVLEGRHIGWGASGGLLGTVMGLIRAFAAVATINPAEKANLLSASISVAMNCTAFGLMTAVPLLFVHAFLQTKTTELIDSLEMASVKFLNAITERQTPAAAA